jgi:hypothetical protein
MRSYLDYLINGGGFSHEAPKWLAIIAGLVVALGFAAWVVETRMSSCVSAYHDRDYCEIHLDHLDDSRPLP